jgi:hypothetical protein
VREGRGQSAVMGLEESAAVLRVMDKVRRAHGVRYGEAVEGF